MKPKKAFVIMPFAGEFDSIYADLIKSAMEEAGYETTRADDFLNQQNILRDIVQGIAEADIIIADLTTLNANVFYELGLCHGRNIPTVLIAQSMSDVPFDLRSYRVIIYSLRFDEVAKLKKSLSDIVKGQMDGTVTFGNPVEDFWPQSNNESLVLRKPDEQQIESEVNQIFSSDAEEGKGFIDFLADLEQSTDGFVAFAGQAAAKIEEFSEIVTERAGKLDRLVKRNAPGTASLIQREVKETAKEMVLFSNEMENFVVGMSEFSPRFESSLMGIIAFFESDPEGNRDNIEVYKEQISQLADSIATPIEQTKGFRDTMDELRSMNMSRDVTEGASMVYDSLDQVVASFSSIQSFCFRASNLLDEQLDEKDEL